MRLPDGTLHYLHTDHLGSVVLATDGSGAVVGENRPRYDAFGNERVPSVSTLPTELAFTGQRLDDSSLMYFGARYYDPALGTFISPDSIIVRPGDPTSLNRYAYSANNPLRYVDPTGHDWQDVVYTVNEFAGGFLAEWAYVNSAQMAQSLAVQPNESVAATAGRATADVFGIYQGVEFMAGGIGLMGAGVASCATGVLCPAGAGALAGGGVVAVDGAVVTGFAAVNGGKNLSNLYMTATASNSSGQAPQTVYRGGASLNPRSIDVKIDPQTGLVQPGRGVSVFNDPGRERRSGEHIESTLFPMVSRSSNVDWIRLISRLYPLKR